MPRLVKVTANVVGRRWANLLLRNGNRKLAPGRKLVSRFGKMTWNVAAVALAATSAVPRERGRFNSFPLPVLRVAELARLRTER